MNTRLKQFLAAENITQAQFADSINVVRASVSHILSGRNNPSFDFIRSMMATYPNLNIDWLMFGKGRMYKDSPAADNDLLFPVEDQETPSRAADIPLNIEQDDPEPPLSELNASINNIQHIAKQRKVVKILVLFDDGTYQEM